MDCSRHEDDDACEVNALSRTHRKWRGLAHIKIKRQRRLDEVKTAKVVRVLK
jgi:hypothetical protein